MIFDFKKEDLSDINVYLSKGGLFKAARNSCKPEIQPKAVILSAYHISPWHVYLSVAALKIYSAGSYSGSQSFLLSTSNGPTTC